MKYLFEVEEVTCDSIAAELGVSAKLVKPITFGAGWVEVTVNDSIANPLNEQKMKAIMVRNGKIWGKKKG